MSNKDNIVYIYPDCVCSGCESKRGLVFSNGIVVCSICNMRMVDKARVKRV